MSPWFTSTTEKPHGGSIAGMKNGKPEHFKHKHLAPLMPGFDMLVMEIPLRNTSEVIKLARLDSRDVNKTAWVTSTMKTNPSYSLPPHLMSGIQCRQIKVKKDDDAALERAVEEACKEMLERTGGKGFPVLVNSSSKSPSVVAAVRKVVGTALLYTHNGSEKNEATEAELEEWVRRWKRGEETRVLVTDEEISRGWEAKELVVIGESVGTENLVMRACGFCFLVKIE